MKQSVEVRSYTLRPGSGAAFDALVREQSLPMLQRWGVDVVFCGPSRHEADSYCLIRAYANLTAREASQDAFYGSAEWREGPREAILALIDTYTTVVLDLDAESLHALRRSLS